MRRIPHRYQSTEWTCGPAVARMALAAFGVRVTERTLARRMETNPRTGTRQAELIRCLKRAGLSADARRHRRLDRLARALKAGAIVIVLYRDRDGEEGHYALLIGADKRRVRLRDPWYGPDYSLPRREFLSRWHDTARLSLHWAAVVTEKKGRG
jgi:ABC-type bacteriocin/lantibiotic exporter with double-glycine peptidase domain